MNARANCNDSARGCGRGDDKRVVSNGVQSTTKQIQTGWQEGLEPYIRSPPRVTNYGALLLGYVGCLFFARDGWPFEMDRDESCFGPRFVAVAGEAARGGINGR
jgi:hypothetical protein